MHPRRNAMTSPSEEPTLRNGKPLKPASAPSEPKLAYSEVTNPPAPRTDRIARGAGRVTPPRRTATPPMAAPHQMAPRPHHQHGHPQQRPSVPVPPAQAHRAAPPPGRAHSPAPAGHRSAGQQQAMGPAPAPAPKRTGPRLTGPEWAAAAAMIVLVLAVILGLALA
ncbi:hypothetical protein AXK61_17270 [Tsukamurella pseudospumae]|uniref:Translation initiation factor IF-2 n=2 Tax=Tsukamurella pseudospumae TaxID=239498 RepID=A0A137ZN05_9ACTN|nr:hypothetical protein AXK61_17270 [Tsukamurella pseudospumae]